MIAGVQRGTCWVDPGLGSDVADLLTAVGQDPFEMGKKVWLEQTDLRLTGEPLTSVDRVRIRRALAEVRRQR